MMRPPPSSTLFPYTTLFRSKPDLDFWLLDELRSVVWSEVERAADLGCGTGRTGAWLAAHGVRRIDRKSTRLNSSHRCISYAVFCLKKKNQLSWNQAFHVHTH